MLSSASRGNFARKFGQDTKAFVERCEVYSARLYDAAESEKSEPLRKCLLQMAEETDTLIVKLFQVLDPTKEKSP